MKKLLEFLLTGCWHHWEVHNEKKIFDTGTKIKYGVEEGDEVPLPCGSKYILRCKHCGEMKVFDTMKVW
jgi:hypothetical protein